MWFREAVTRSDKKYSPSELPSGKIQLIQGIVCFLLCSLIAGLGSLTFFELKKDEMRNFKSQLISVSLSVTENATGGLKRKILAASLISKIYATAMQDGYGGTSPNFTLPGFESEMTVMMELSGSKTIIFYPLITNETRQGWEEYAEANIDILALNGGRTAGDGIYTQSPTGIISSPSHATGSNHPTWLFPVWQVAPARLTSSITMYDPYGVIGSRRNCIDRVIQTSTFAFTDIVQLLTDEGVITPSTILYSPIMGPGTKNPIVGLASIAFSWGEVLNGILPGNHEVDCVVTTKTSTHTFNIPASGVAGLQVGDQHDTNYDAFAKAFSPLAGTDYMITIYPVKSFHDDFITSNPQNSCVIVVLLIAFTTFLVLVNCHLARSREKELTESAKHSFAGAAAREAVLLAKKVYVRYISHEIRTPLNAAYLGLKVLEKEIAKRKGPFHAEQLCIIRDVVNACDIAVSILNDLLNYDKLEDGTLMIEPKKVLALPFVTSAISLFLLQAEEKGVRVVFDMDMDFSDTNTTPLDSDSNPHSNTTASYLGKNDYINVDEHKMSQVIRNLVSNAIKFTPDGSSVTIKLRKVTPRKSLPHYERQSSDIFDTHCHNSSGRGQMFKRDMSLDDPLQEPACEGDLDVELGLLQRWYSRITCPPPPSGRLPLHGPHDFCSADEDYGSLVLDVIDSGVGMAPEDSRRIFNEVVQFNPGELQAGGGSGLGMMIAKALVDLHSGQVSVHSAGVGQGSTFTLKVHLCSAPDAPPSDTPSTASATECSGSATMIGTGTGTGGLDSLLRSMIAISSLTKSTSPSPSPGSSTAPAYMTPHSASLSCCPNIATAEETRATSPARASPSHSSRNPAFSFSDDIYMDMNLNVDLDIDLDLDIETKTRQHTSDPAVHRVVTPQSPLTRPEDLIFPPVPPRVIVRRLNILVVDDSKLNRKMLIKLLNTEDHYCDEAEDGLVAVDKVTKSIAEAEAESSLLHWTRGNFIKTISKSTSLTALDTAHLRKSPSIKRELSNKHERRSSAAASHYDAILMDFMMPNMDGPTATRAIRNLGYRGLILGVTGNALPSDIQFFISNGADQVLLKPVDIDSLEAALYRLGGGRDTGTNGGVNVARGMLI